PAIRAAGPAGPLCDALVEARSSPRVDLKAVLEGAGRGGLYEDVVQAAAGMNTKTLVARATADPRYRAAQNRAVPRKIGSRLWLFDCVNCDKCVPVCPNDANFVYETGLHAAAYENYRVQRGTPVA